MFPKIFLRKMVGKIEGKVLFGIFFRKNFKSGAKNFDQNVFFRKRAGKIIACGREFCSFGVKRDRS